jgi:hypothetical protein
MAVEVVAAKKGRTSRKGHGHDEGGCGGGGTSESRPERAFKNGRKGTRNEGRRASRKRGWNEGRKEGH